MDAQLEVLRDAGIDHLDAVINTVRGLHSLPRSRVRFQSWDYL